MTNIAGFAGWWKRQEITILIKGDFDAPWDKTSCSTSFERSHKYAKTYLVGKSAAVLLPKQKFNSKVPFYFIQSKTAGI